MWGTYGQKSLKPAWILTIIKNECFWTDHWVLLREHSNVSGGAAIASKSICEMHKNDWRLVMACGLLVDKPCIKKRLLCTYTEFSVGLLIQIDPGENIARVLLHVEDTSAVRKLLQIHFIVNPTGRCTLKDNKKSLK